MAKYIKYGISATIMFGIVTYGSYKYHQIRSFEEEYYKNSNRKRQFLFNIHQNLAILYDKSVDSYEDLSKINQYRKILLSYAQGFVLETAIGTSRNLKFYPPGVKVLGIDWSSNMLEAAMQKSVNHISYSYKIDDTENLTFKDNVFDTVVDTFGLEYYVNPDKALKEMKRVCKKDGLILILASGQSLYQGLNFFLNYKTPYTVCNYGFFPNRNWEEFIKEEDFEILKKERKINGTVYMYVLRNKK
ncbi:ubiquinone/menaquinone biosynthesis methyltransferase family protein (macronuclear) [Tetrahymena thermophila SB210]|uniref:Ubiquinone/menaquinone biosynthesis methyltransferase family protein n=1 Tax=Tetrahymena thermophila (strain SB210) TaxID=312017 RepID=Q22YS4_TETTS|nr:ubiquinone/menaquinone biosynthesis methyltransferase family protein [Tetrahymena thermophila SB210]EAR90597.1 ubiquinone/menaquinone biosynthesis methyltransferase family protein [Tetrahymena thermophila SB210]|eukprot:XP_001010842.1 ubiquinone/menaquinone biosynthesis methyltransferase family protein [Tetrahymena thermophila SB210]